MPRGLSDCEGCLLRCFRQSMCKPRKTRKVVKRCKYRAVFSEQAVAVKKYSQTLPFTGVAKAFSGKICTPEMQR